MPTTTFMDDGTDGCQTLVSNRTNWGVITGTTTSTTEQVHTGSRAIKFDSGVGNAVATLAKTAITADAGRRLTVWLYFRDLPTADVGIIRISTSAGAIVGELQLRTTGKLRFSSSTQGSDGTVTITTGVWIRISIAYTVSSTSVNEWRCFVQRPGDSGGVADATATNLTLTNATSNGAKLGWQAAPGASKVFYADDIYMDDGTTLDDIGDTRVTYKAPTTTTVNTFDTTVGTGAVNERPMSTTNGMTHAANGSVATLNYAIETAAGGEVNMEGCSIRDYCGWILYAGPAASDKPTLNNINGANLGVSASGLINQMFAGATTYPSSAAAIGVQRTVANATDLSLFECGVMVAFAPGLYGGLGGNPYGARGASQMQQLLAQ